MTSKRLISSTGHIKIHILFLFIIFINFFLSFSYLKLMAGSCDSSYVLYSFMYIYIFLFRKIKFNIP